jgi:putative transposase
MMDSWSFDGVKASDSKRLGAIKKVFTNHTKQRPAFQWCNQYSSRIYQNAFQHLMKAFKNWRDPNLPKFGMPQFKKKRHECSFTVDSSNGSVLVKAGKTIKVPTLGTFRLKEAIPYDCISQSFTISRKAGKWFISFMVKACPVPEMKHSRDVVGIDLGVKTFATLSDGTTIQTPSQLKKAKIKLSKQQWRNRNKVAGNRRQGIASSNNAHKYFQQLRKQHNHIANVREDFLQKTTTQICKTYQHIKLEDLNIRGMMANHKLAEAIGNLGLYRFRELIGYKQPFHGHIMTLVDRWFPSSKTGSCCGHIQPMPLKDRTFHCGGCGAVIDRDLNAAINLERWEPNQTLPVATGIRTAVDLKGPSPKGKLEGVTPSKTEAAIKQLCLFV